jgi:glycosyltransferase involved in cell wall biosynthesis
MSTVIVDWLGRGGIAQTSEAWAIEARAAGVDVQVVTRPGRELGSGAVRVHEAPARSGRLSAHRAVAREAARLVRSQCPDVVVVQNYVAPVLERPVYDAVRAVGARLVVVVHDHRLHTLRAGTRTGLAARLRAADTVVTHSRYVAHGVRRYCGRADVEVIPHPAQVGVLRHPRESPPGLASTDERLVAGTFGVLKRSYKGGTVVGELAASGLDNWRFVAVGTGASATAGVTAVPGYVSPGALVGAMSATDATLAPYRHATQSGVVALAHLLGSVPIASAVGGIPEQIDDGVDGLLLAPGAPNAAWRSALEALTDDDFRKTLAANGEARAWRDHEQFTRRIRELVR